jgi:hypothetical protein
MLFTGMSKFVFRPTEKSNESVYKESAQKKKEDLGEKQYDVHVQHEIRR